MTDKELLEAIRVRLDKGFVTAPENYLSLEAIMAPYTGTLDDIEELLESNGYPSLVPITEGETNDDM